ncbi:gamma-glutamyl-gamma-aminobutyrate hydrolase family protein [Microbacterium sp. ZW T5_56]|uniref:gamma-glutamyl-gamma-aminobutyrate hydrolase family protein n=1 Tax=Microbacterium sp. ZW T5_56 TaxID=3378081 RepID=UPI003854E6B5
MSERIPVIGITTYRQSATWGTWPGVDADLLPAAYARAVEEAGGAPVLLPPVADAAMAAAVADRLDGIIVAGGADVSPSRYGQEPDPAVTVWYDDRDASELAYLAAADADELPVLGICRGMQLMAVAAGGTLIQHLPDAGGDEVHSGGDGVYGHVAVNVAHGTRIAQILGERAEVECHHHQGVGEHPGYVVTARGADGIAHAMERPGDRFVVGVQWHPEEGADRELFAALVAAARARAR